MIGGSRSLCQRIIFEISFSEWCTIIGDLGQLKLHSGPQGKHQSLIRNSLFFYQTNLFVCCFSLKSLKIICMFGGISVEGDPEWHHWHRMWFRPLAVPNCLSPVLHLHFTSFLNYFNYTLVGSVYLYVSIFFPLLVWQGVSASGKNVGGPKIATCGCQLTAGYAASFYNISHINRWHPSSRDLRSSNRTYENSDSLHTPGLMCVWVSECYFHAIYWLFSAGTESSRVLFPNSFVGTFCLLLLSVQVCLWLHGQAAPPPFIFQNTKVWIWRSTTKQVPNV